MKESNSAFYRSIGKSMLGRYSVYGINLLSMMLLTRLFTPETFGTVAAIMVFFTFFQLMAEVGLGPAIINLDKLAEEDRNGLFGLTLLMGAGLAGVFLLLTPVFVDFYQLPRVDEVIPYVAAALLFFAPANLPSALLQRDQAYFRIAHAGIAAEIASTLMTVILLQFIDPLHALASKATTTAATTFAMQFHFSRYTEFGQPRWGRKFSAVKPLLSFSGYQLGFNFINYFSRNLDNILIGRYLGAAPLGFYDKAYQLMRYPLLLLTFAMTPAIQPTVRKFADDPARVEAFHRDFTFKLSLIGAVAGLGIYLLADWIVLLMLGHQWDAVVPIIKVLAIAVPVQVVLATHGSFYQAMNRANLLFYNGLISATLMISAIVWGVMQRDVIVLSWAIVVAFHLNFFQIYYIMYSRIYGRGYLRFLLRMIPAAVIILGMVLWY